MILCYVVIVIVNNSHIIVCWFIGCYLVLVVGYCVCLFGGCGSLLVVGYWLLFVCCLLLVVSCWLLVFIGCCFVGCYW